MGRIRNKDIAEMVGVSRTAVTQVLNGSRPGCVSAEKREAIFRIAREYNYLPDFAAQVLGSGRTRTIGMPMPWMQNLGSSPNISELLAHLTMMLKQAGYMLTLQPVANDDPQTICREIEQLIRSGRVDGIFCNACFIDPEIVSALQSTRIPAVTYALSSDNTQLCRDISGVCFDWKPALSTLIGSLQAYGPTAAVFAKPLGGSQNRIGFLQNVPDLAAINMKRDFFFPWDNAATAMVQVLENWECFSRFRCWIMQNDRMANGAANVVRQKGLVPGKDILIAGFDNLEEGRDEPFFTTVDDPIAGMAQSCVELLMDQLGGKNCGVKHVKLPSNLIYRASTAPVNPE